MQSVSAAFTAEEVDYVRSISSNLLVSWKKETNLGATTFTIGVSLIGGDDGIGINPSAVGGPSIYTYFDESEYLLSLAWERELNMPLGGLTKALAEAELDNTSGRFTPRYVGGQSELFTAILPRRPVIINAGFNFGGIDNQIPQFAGVLSKQPYVDSRSKKTSLQMADYTDFFQNRYLDQEIMFTAQRTDQVIETVFQSAGMNTAQYDLDEGISVIPFGLFETGSRYSNIINQVVQAENGHLYQDEQGIFKFENRQHWDSSPYNSVSRILLTGQVIDSEIPNEDHIINVVEVYSEPRFKQPMQPIYTLGSPIEITAGESKEVFVSFDDPVLEALTPTYQAYVDTDLTGSDMSGDITLKVNKVFAQAAKYTFTNTNASTLYITKLEIQGRPARKVTTPVYYRAERQLSVTAYEEQPIRIENPYIYDQNWANSYAQMILNDFAQPESLQKITIRAIPSLQMGDLISWQGRYWRVFGIKSKLDVSNGFIQQLTLLQRDIITYFRIGISTIGGSDQIAP